MAATIPKPFNFISTESSRRTHSKLPLSFSPNPQKPISHRRHLHISNSITNANPSSTITSTTTNPPETTIPPRFDPDAFRKGSDVLVEALEREGVTNVFAYPGGDSMEIHQALTRSNIIRNILPRHGQGGIFAAEGYARSSGLVGVCIATSGPGATNLLVVPDWDKPMKLPGYLSRLPKTPNVTHLEQIIRLISESKKPVLYVGGGCLNSSEELRRFVELTGIPVTMTLMGLGAYPCLVELSLQMLGMHGTVYANYAVNEADLLLAFGVRFDDRVTGKLEAFASRAKIVHLDIDPAEIGKSKLPHVSICSDVKVALAGMNRLLEGKSDKLKFDFSAWREELDKKKIEYPLNFKTFGEAIPQYAIQVLDELTNWNAIISTGVGQHQMWAAQWYKYKRLHQWLTSGGLGAMGFGLPAAIGAAVANPDSVVVDIDGDGSFIMNIQELATSRVENLPVKIMLLNNQHLGMVVQWEDRFYKANRAHSYLGNPSKETEIFPDMLKFAEACDVPGARVTKKGDLRAAIQ